MKSAGFPWFAAVLCLAGAAVYSQDQPGAHHHHASQSTESSDAPTSGMDQSAQQMASRNLSDSAHMRMTSLRPLKPGDQQRADDILAGARKAMERYRDYHVAMDEGFQIFLPNLPQKMYHFTNYRYAWEEAFTFNPEHPTSLLYEKQGPGAYRLIGVMYTAPAAASFDQLDERVPLSVGQWHAHVNFCTAPKGREREYFGSHPKFGLLGSITTRKQCEAEGGRFLPQVFGWMVHVYPDEKNPAQIWSVERQMEHGHDHAMH
ncbi:MAG: hypothetical protein JO041_13255 [Acidobacteria bacterium]|nr:hypothetical protein [Acidobacteriota bacterium]